jgi:hypothetical protein
VRGVFEQQSMALDAIKVSEETRDKIFARNFERLFV